jgi:FlaA1/EpsC-like NDP-sugar epimerase
VGSIGSEIVSYLISKKAQVKVYDNNEFRIFECSQKYPQVEYVVGDVRDRDKLEMEMKGCDIVIHAAALKHVFLCYENSIEAVKTNILGTQNVIDSAIKSGVKKVLYISTDKAVNPISVMGATKFIGERLVLSANGKTKFSVVRFGNVKGTSGSIIPIWYKQVSEGKPITITKGNPFRFFMSKEDSIKLIFKALNLMKGGEIFVFKMEEKNIESYADFLFPRAKKIYIDMRPGEKIHEELMTAEEKLKAKETKDMWII